jgi:hypothetical protein
LSPFVRIEHHEAAAFEFTAQKLLPVVPVRVRTAEHEVAVVIHQRQSAAADADLAAIGHIDRLRPQLLPVDGIHATAMRMSLFLTRSSASSRSLPVSLARSVLSLRQHEFALLRRERGVDEEDAAIADGD